jgi:hypothetical protein
MKKLKITIEGEFTDNRITIEGPAIDDLRTMLQIFEHTLRRLGFDFEGRLEIVEDEK